jgi:hypothetical protein
MNGVTVGVGAAVAAAAAAPAVVESYAKSGTDANVRKLAQSLARTIKDHLDKAEKLRSALGGA